MDEILRADDRPSIGMAGPAIVEEVVYVKGHFSLQCVDAEGKELWAEEVDNVVCTIGKNLILDAALAGSAYTVVGPFMGLISSTSFTAVAAADTMASHSGWLEAGLANAPTYTAPRKTCAWSSASAGAKALSAALSFVMTGSGTIDGIFLCSGTGAVSTIDNTSGTLVSAGTLSANQPVISGNTVNASYTMSL